ncbi:hypothetical protein Mgra_00006845 [Meloidogyne graminicola]|uniref:Secreted protein n=1 Tax=Meloidogyne graminicola TaxID=189291 RepID=A0A8S9ZK68_9BILA|nr:hypothetical protein Mgra_00006845 [Meloidogyne graminicola]
MKFNSIFQLLFIFTIINLNYFVNCAGTEEEKISLTLDNVEQYFTINTNDGKKKAICKNCNKEYNYKLNRAIGAYNIHVNKCLDEEKKKGS